MPSFHQFYLVSFSPCFYFFYFLIRNNFSLNKNTGVGGNLVAVQASRMSTFLHQKHPLGKLDAKEKDLCISPFKTFFGNSKKQPFKMS